MPIKYKQLGLPLNRLDGPLKVMGKATYAAEFPVADTVYGFPVQSTIAAGEITWIDTAAAEKAPGVLKVITHLNALKLQPRPAVTAENRMTRSIPVLQSTTIHCYGQYIGIVVAQTYEQARYAARLVQVSYRKDKPRIDFDAHVGEAYKPAILNAGHATDTTRGDIDEGLRGSAALLDETYETPIEHHHPMEPHTSLVFFKGEKLTVYESTQMLEPTREAIANTFGIAKDHIQVLSPYVGGGFGSKLQAREHLMLTIMAAKLTGRPVKTAITRQMMQTNVGLRQCNRQHMLLGATQTGKLQALAHETVTHTSVDEEFVEQTGSMSRMMYAVPNSLVTHRVFTTHIQVPRWTRSPGETPGSFALESAMDELAFKLKMDPVAFRLQNEPAKSPENGKPWGSRSLVQCLQTGAKEFDWKRRKQEPRANRKGRWLVGYGMAGASRGAPFRECSARIKVQRTGQDVRAIVEMAATDIGTGSYTVIAQAAAEILGLAPAKIAVAIGDSALPPTPGSGGSWGGASFANAVATVGKQLMNALQAKTTVRFIKAPTVTELMIAADLSTFEQEGAIKPSADFNNYAHFSYAAHFVEVHVEESLGIVKIPHIHTTAAAGTILNEKTARSQIIGGVVWGIGQAMTEESVLDSRYGNYVTRTLADYHVPVNLDVGKIDVRFLAEEDKVINPLGAKGVGELGITGVAAAIANAVFNATGIRVRHLPITPDKLLG